MMRISPISPISHNFDSGLGPNLLLNSGFEDYTGVQDNGVSDAFTSWSVTSDDSDNGLIEATADNYSSTNAVKLRRGTGTLPNLYQNADVESEVAYLLDIYTKSGDGVLNLRYYIRDNTGAVNIISATLTDIVDLTYKRYQVQFNTPVDCVSVRIGFYSGVADTGAYVYLDNATLRKVL